LTRPARSALYHHDRQRRTFKKRRAQRHFMDDKITADVVQLVNLEGRSMGHVALADAKLLAKQKGLRLLCVMPLANPPVCRLQRPHIEIEDAMFEEGLDDADADADANPDLDPDADVGFDQVVVMGRGPDADAAAAAAAANQEQGKKPKSSRRHVDAEKEVRFSDTIAEHDVQIKTAQLRRFLSKGIRVRVSIYFKKVISFDAELAEVLLENITSRVSDLCTVEGNTNYAQRFVSILLVPKEQPKEKEAAEK